MIKRLLSPGQDARSKGGILQNFSMKNVQAAMADDAALCVENAFDMFDEEDALNEE